MNLACICSSLHNRLPNVERAWLGGYPRSNGAANYLRGQGRHHHNFEFARLCSSGGESCLRVCWSRCSRCSQAAVSYACNFLFDSRFVNVRRRYQDDMSAAENINFLPSILSRFDLIFIVRDVRDRERDERLAKHVVVVRTKARVADIVPERFLKIVLLHFFVAPHERGVRGRCG